MPHTDTEPGQPPKLTVFTPTYNRAYTLPGLFASLQAQTVQDFEWLVVDDGSSDGTRELVADYAEQAGFAVRYHWQPNGGKHAATNAGVRLARSPLFLTFDSDDEMLPTTVENFLTVWEAIPAAERHRYAGVTGLCVTPDGERVGTGFPSDVFDSTTLASHYRYGVTGEKCGFTRTDVMREFPFPVHEGVGFVPESLVWNKIGASYLTRYVNIPMRILIHRPDGFTLGTAAVPLDAVVDERAYVLDHALGHMVAARTYQRYFRLAHRFALESFQLGRGPVRQFRQLRTWGARAVWLVGMPLAYARQRRLDLIAARRERTTGR